MTEKRKRDRDDGDGASDKKKQKKGFRVGPENLPDGLWKRKNQEIKQSLIEKAKIRRDFAKLKKQGKVPEQEESLPQPASLALDAVEEVDTVPHPDRQTLIEQQAEEPEPMSERTPRRRKLKAVPFKKEHEQAQQRKQEAEDRRKAKEEAARQRQQKLEEREKFRKAMAKARTGGWNGQRKLGRESKPLLEKVKRIMGEKG